MLVTCKVWINFKKCIPFTLTSQNILLLSWAHRVCHLANQNAVGNSYLEPSSFHRLYHKAVKNFFPLSTSTFTLLYRSGALVPHAPFPTHIIHGIDIHPFPLKLELNILEGKFAPLHIFNLKRYNFLISMPMHAYWCNGMIYIHA